MMTLGSLTKVSPPSLTQASGTLVATQPQLNHRLPHPPAWAEGLLVPEILLPFPLALPDLSHSKRTN